MNKKAIVFLLVFAMVIVACGDTTEEAAVEATEEEHDHEGESTLEQVQERGFLKCGVSTGATGFTEVGTTVLIQDSTLTTVMQLLLLSSVITVKLNLNNLLQLKDLQHLALEKLMC